MTEPMTQLAEDIAEAKLIAEAVGVRDGVDALNNIAQALTGDGEQVDCVKDALYAIAGALRQVADAIRESREDR